MTRREKIVSELGLNKIVQESIKRHPRFADKRVGFIDGAEWMQEIMIDKACEWLKEHGDDFGVPESESGRVYVDDLVCEFRKAMEE